MISLLAIILTLLFQITISTFVAWAGAPFISDDPETVGALHWEIDVASQMLKDKFGMSGTVPQVEVNYGLLPDMDLHTVVPLSYVSPNEGSTSFGVGDIELGAKYRFVQESNRFPMVATFPLAEIPTGDHKRALGSGHVRAFIPLWLQKSWEGWTTSGGGGYWIYPGSENKNYWLIGWVVQRDLSKKITLGTELLYTTSQARKAGSHMGFNAGGSFNFSEEHHLLFSAGRDMHGSNRFSMYVGYQLTLGPREEKKEGSLSFTRSKIPYK